MKNKIIGIKISSEVDDLVKVQEVLTDYGNVIRTRIGINQLEDDKTGLRGLLLLELNGDKNQIKNFKTELNNIKGVKIGKLKF